MNILQQLIAQSKGRFFTVTFQKKDGTIRVMNGKTGKNYKIRGQAQPMWDRKSQDIRSFRFDSVLSISINGFQIKVK